MSTPPQELIDFAAHLARESGAMIVEYFNTPIAVQQKADNTPVTVVDRKAEALMRTLIEAHYPEHQVLGEEDGLSGDPSSGYQWVLDPIDGTKAFIHGVPLFGTLIALVERGEPILGVIHLPVLGDMLIGAAERPTTLNGTPVRVSRVSEPEEATVLCTSTSDLFRLGYGEGWQRIQRAFGLVRTWGDCFGHFLVATGRAEAMVDPVLSLWDVAALKPCIEGAGGTMTDVRGQVTGMGDSALSTNGAVHEAVLAMLHTEG